MQMGTMVKTAAIALVGAVAIYLLVLASSEDEEEILVYGTVAECIASGENAESECRAEFSKAEKLHEEVAPRYAQESDCRSRYDGCYRRNSGGSSFFVPLMLGYMLAPRGSRFSSTQPLYRTPSDGRFYTAGNGRVGAVSASGRASVAKSKATPPTARTRTVSRGGFGARAAGRGSAGG
jgi:uncharacterized protein YgiB involved in biofilm formation